MRAKHTRASSRQLIVTADDFGIGPETSRGILHLAMLGRVTCTVLLVNSPFAHEAVGLWRKLGQPCELGWHPCLTLDSPISKEANSLTTKEGRFFSLGAFLTRLATLQIRYSEVVRELQAQLLSFREQVGSWPRVVNAHHHLHVFPLVFAALREVLLTCVPRPYLRVVREPYQSLRAVPGALAKRALLTALGAVAARRQRADCLPGNDWLAGITNPECVGKPRFLQLWLGSMPTGIVELTCHPGYADDSLIGRDVKYRDAGWSRRVLEFDLLRADSFVELCEQLGYQFVSPPKLSSISGLQRRCA